jgi:hypothetical protein
MRGMEEQRCMCGDDECMHYAFRYPFCRPCDEHHRPPECAIDSEGRSLDPSGRPWDDAP